MMYVLFVFLLTLPSYLCADWQSAYGHGRAIVSAQKGDWKGAQEHLQATLVHNPDDATVLYDLGVTSYKQNEFDRARVYFEAVTNSKLVPLALQEQAYFNAGNTAVAQKKLPDAVDAYEQVLKINSHNEAARHNLELVKKMLEDQQKKERTNKQEKQQDEKKDEKQDQSDQSDGQDKQEQSEQQDKGQEQGNKDGSGNEQQQSEDQEQDQQKGQQQKGSGENKKNKGGKSNKADDQQDGDDASDDDQLKQKEDKAQQDTQDRKQQGKDKNQAADKQQREQQQGSQDKGQREQEKHTDPSRNGNDTRKQNTKDTKNKQEKGRTDAGTEDATPSQQPQTAEQRWIAQLMEQQEKRDANANKQVIRRAINQKLSGNHGQNRW